MQQSFFKTGSVICLLLLGFGWSINSFAQGNSINGFLSQETYFFIKKNMDYKDFPLLEDFKDPLKYGKDRAEGKRWRLFVLKAKNDVPINIYFRKPGNLITSIEVVVKNIRDRVCLREYLYKHGEGAQIGNLDSFLERPKNVLDTKLGPGKKSYRVKQNCLDYKTNFGIISFVVTKDARGDEYISGVRILFDND